ncbi:MAG: DedA family protein [Candidatus Lambdaproteobacteria bacterium]|nr:DedA family protein [Candidatus Lambdaproteobacteria bacterium]
MQATPVARTQLWKALWFWGLPLAGLALVGAALAWAIRSDAVVWLAQANAWIADTVIARLGYFGVFLLMFIESSFIPFPSEIVIPPAADLARRSAEWNLAAVIGVGTLGSLAGALFNYYLALYLGRPMLIGLIHRYGRYFRLSIAGYEAAESLFARHGDISTFTGRLIPAIRQIISLPAGLARMNLLRFCLLTSAGAGLWVAVLAFAGYWFGADPQRLAEVLREYSHWLVAAALVLIGGYLLRLRLRRPRPAERP